MNKTTLDRRAKNMLEKYGDAAFSRCTNEEVVIRMGLRRLQSGASGAEVAALLAEHCEAQEARRA